MKIFKAILKNAAASPYSQSRYHGTPQVERETSIAYSERTWREYAHFDKAGHVFVPQMSLKNCLSETAKYLGLSIPGRGKRTYTRAFEAGLSCFDPMFLYDPLTNNPITVEQLIGDRLFLPSDGVRGSGKRVAKIYPRIDQWQGEATLYVLDDTITEAVLLRHLVEAGKFVGIGRFRPSKNGFYGRFDVLTHECQQIEGGFSLDSVDNDDEIA